MILRFQLIKRPSIGFWEILESRRVKLANIQEPFFPTDAVGLIQGPAIAILAAVDIAEKAANVKVAEIRGICPSHITVIAVYGDTSAVIEALNAVQNTFKETIFNECE